MEYTILNLNNGQAFLLDVPKKNHESLSIKYFKKFTIFMVEHKLWEKSDSISLTEGRLDSDVIFYGPSLPASIYE